MNNAANTTTQVFSLFDDMGYDGIYLLGVFSSRELAMAAWGKFIAVNPAHEDYLIIPSILDSMVDSQ